MTTFREVIDLWPSPAILAKEIGRKRFAVAKWRNRDSIPASDWVAICEAGKARGFELDVERLAQIAAGKRAA